MKILVTGSSGHLDEALLRGSRDTGHESMGFAELSRGEMTTSRCHHSKLRRASLDVTLDPEPTFRSISQRQWSLPSPPKGGENRAS